MSDHSHTTHTIGCVPTGCFIMVESSDHYQQTECHHPDCRDQQCFALLFSDSLPFRIRAGRRNKTIQSMENSQNHEERTAENSRRRISFEDLVALSGKVLEALGHQTALPNISSLNLIHPHPNIINHVSEKSALLSSSASDLKTSLINLRSSCDAPEKMKEALRSLFNDLVPKIIEFCMVLCSIPNFTTIKDLSHKRQKLARNLNDVQELKENLNNAPYPAICLVLYLIIVFLAAFSAPHAVIMSLNATAAAVQSLKDCLNLLLGCKEKRYNKEMQVMDFVLLNVCSKVQTVAKIKEIMDSLNDKDTMDGCHRINMVERHTDLDAWIKETLAAIEDIMKLEE